MSDEKTPKKANVLTTIKEHISTHPWEDIFRSVAVTIGLILVWRTVLLRERQNKSLCAGINRQEAEDEKSSRERSSEPLGPEFCAVGREAYSEA